MFRYKQTRSTRVSQNPFSNDCGYAEWFKKAEAFLRISNDALGAIDYISLSLKRSFPVFGRTLSKSFIKDYLKAARTKTDISSTMSASLLYYLVRCVCVMQHVAIFGDMCVLVL